MLHNNAMYMYLFFPLQAAKVHDILEMEKYFRREVGLEIKTSLNLELYLHLDILATLFRPFSFIASRHF
jgi:uncharacterized membrane protein